MASVELVVMSREVLAAALTRGESVESVVLALGEREWVTGEDSRFVARVRAAFPPADVFLADRDCAWVHIDTQAHGWAYLLSGIPALCGEGAQLFDPISYDEVLSGEQLMEMWEVTDPEPWDADRFRDAATDIEVAIRSHPGFSAATVVSKNSHLRLELQFVTGGEVGALGMSRLNRAAGDTFEFWTRRASRERWDAALASDYLFKDESLDVSIGEHPAWQFSGELGGVADGEYIEFEYGDDQETVRTKCAQAIAASRSFLDCAADIAPPERPTS
jgi:hypothetical protein